jgi:periplasmic protein TonB
MMERPAPAGAATRSPWPAAAVSAALHGAVALALMTIGLPARTPTTAARVVEVIMVSEAPQPGNADDQAEAEKPVQATRPTPPIPMVTAETAPEFEEPAAMGETVAPKALDQASFEVLPTLPAQVRPRRKPEPPRAGAAPAGSAAGAAPTRNGSHAAVRPAIAADAPARPGRPPGGRRKAATFRPGSAENPSPRYPRLARQRGWEGRVVLLVAVAAAGTPTAVQVETSSGFPTLDRAAIKAVRRWRFHPARLAGRPVPDTIRVPIRFQLADM